MHNECIIPYTIEEQYQNDIISICSNKTYLLTATQKKINIYAFTSGGKTCVLINEFFKNKYDFSVL